MYLLALNLWQRGGLLASEGCCASVGVGAVSGEEEWRRRVGRREEEWRREVREKEGK